MLDLTLIKKIEQLLDIASDCTRLKILFSLFDDDKCNHNPKHCDNCFCMHCMEERSVGEISEIINASQSLVSHQLKVLFDANLIKKRKQGQKVYYSLNDGHIKMLLKIALEHVEER